MTPRCERFGQCGNDADYQVDYWHFDGCLMSGTFCRGCGEDLGRSGALIVKVQPVAAASSCHATARPCALHQERGGA